MADEVLSYQRLARDLDNMSVKLERLSEKVPEKAGRTEMADYVDKQIDSKHADQTEAIKLMMDKLGSGILTDLHKMNDEQQQELMEVQRKFIEEDLPTIVGGLVEDEIERKDRLREEARERERIKAEREAAKAETERAQKEARIYRWLSIIAIAALIFYRVLWPMFAGGEMDAGAVLEEVGGLGA